MLFKCIFLVVSLHQLCRMAHIHKCSINKPTLRNIWQTLSSTAASFTCKVRISISSCTDSDSTVTTSPCMRAVPGCIFGRTRPALCHTPHSPQTAALQRTWRSPGTQTHSSEPESVIITALISQAFPSPCQTHSMTHRWIDDSKRLSGVWNPQSNRLY